MTPTSKEEIIKIIEKLDLKKSAGSDKITSCIIHLTKYIIAPILANLFNVCIFNGIFPDAFKIAEVLPLFKGGARDILGNYRPISLLPQFGKIFEKIMAKRLKNFLFTNDVLTMHQCGFRKSYSTELAVVDMYDHLLEKLDKKRLYM